MQRLRKCAPFKGVQSMATLHSHPKKKVNMEKVRCMIETVKLFPLEILPLRGQRLPEETSKKCNHLKPCKNKNPLHEKITCTCDRDIYVYIHKPSFLLNLHTEEHAHQT